LVRQAEIREERHAEALKKAVDAGFATVQEHEKALAHKTTEIQAARAAEANARSEWLKGENGGREAAAKALETLRELRSSCPEANAMTRKGQFGKLSGSPGLGSWTLTFDVRFTDWEGMKAWLTQNGHRASVDERNVFFEAAAPFHQS
jgi:hypothetical protein